MYKVTSKIVMAIALAFLSMGSLAEKVVIVHPSNTADISKADVERLYLAKISSFSDGTTAVPLNHEESTPVRVAFDSEVVGRTEAQMKSYWSRLLFTGRATPIRQVSNDSEMVSTVSSTPGAIGYVDAGSVDGSVKVLFSF